MACSGSRGFRPRSTLLAAALCLPLAATGPAFAQTAEEVAASMDPAAMQAMDKMSAYLLTLGAFRITGEASTEQVLMTGQKIQFGGTFDILAKRPNAFKIVTQSDIQHREMYYDGKAFTIFSPRSGYYASFPAASSIGLTIDKARREYGIELPLADLFTWGTDQTLRSRVQGALVVRPETIGDRKCLHLAFRQERVDWQLWIEEGARPLPCKMVITNKDDPAMPQYTAVLHWDTQATPAAADLAFAPPPDAQRITLASLGDDANNGADGANANEGEGQ
ncbi:DUF2092 domain-containing protein [Sphingobium naphthae]|uniref:DUF2092 domain-containing protein n=1 Tax=Sphingobium naphthae TaxID=1886786 RepID=A0ABU3ZSC2_9SPHN|nr:DUF2092 domain-containing protein [Sphingobium naphthae]MDV5822387.1 DUF2092 domain-containing protein [Sphingobium naphthae]